MTTSASETDGLSAHERLDEVAQILAVAFLRLAARENASNPRDFGEFPLDFAGPASVHGAVEIPGETPS